MSEINIPDEIAPAQTPFRLSEWLSRMFRYAREALRSIYQWQRDAISVFTFASYGGMSQTGSNVAFPDIGAAYQDLTTFNTISISEPRGITVDLATNSMTVDIAGIYIISVSLAFEHDEVNAGRQTRIQMYDQTLGTPIGGGFPVGTGRNVAVTNANATVLVEITNPGNEIRLQIGGGDTYSAVEIDGLAWSMHSVGEYRGDVLG